MCVCYIKLYKLDLFESFVYLNNIVYNSNFSQFTKVTVATHIIVYTPTHIYTHIIKILFKYLT